MRKISISLLVVSFSINVWAQQNGGESEATVTIKSSKKINPLTKYVMDKYGFNAEQILLQIYSYEEENGVMVLTPMQFEARKEDETGRFVSIVDIEDQIKH